MLIRLAKREDLTSIVEIYNQAIETKMSTADLEPIDVNSRLEWYDQHSPEQYPIFVAEVDHQVVGWISLSAYRPGRAALRFTKEVSYYVHQEYQGQGIGSKMLEFVIQESPKLQTKSLFAIIMEQNTPSIKLLKKFNFEPWGFLPNIAEYDGIEFGQFYYGLRVS